MRGSLQHQAHYNHCVYHCHQPWADRARERVESFHEDSPSPRLKQTKTIEPKMLFCKSMNMLLFVQVDLVLLACKEHMVFQRLIASHTVTAKPLGRIKKLL